MSDDETQVSKIKKGKAVPLPTKTVKEEEKTPV
jgi:hypothetical protein